MNEGEVATRLGLRGIPSAAETIILERDIRLVELSGGRYHAGQISCRASLDIIRTAKLMGLPVTCGVSINHLTLNENDIGPYRTFFKMKPPLRSEDDRRAMVEGVASGDIDVIVSAHDPRGAEGKRRPFAEAADGAVGLETMLGAALRLYHNGEVELTRLLASADHQSGAAARARQRTPRQRRAGRSRADRSRPALGGRAGSVALQIQEHAVRRGTAAGPRAADRRCRSPRLQLR